MSEQGFQLTPFRREKALQGLAIDGSIARAGNCFSIAFRLTGNLRNLSIPQPAAVPMRRGGLWEETCFEFFLSPEGLARYREFNLSPSGDWNAFAFSSYREGMSEEEAVDALAFSCARSEKEIHVSCKLDSEVLVPAGQTLEVAVCAVVRPRSGEVSYWALSHLSTRPDFHLRESFRLKI